MQNSSRIIVSAAISKFAKNWWKDFQSTWSSETYIIWLTKFRFISYTCGHHHINNQNLEDKKLGDFWGKSEVFNQLHYINKSYCPV